MKKVLFINKLKKFFVISYGYALVLSVILVFLVFFSIPTKLRVKFYYSAGVVKSIELAREPRLSRTAFSKHYVEYYEIVLVGNQEKKYRCFSKIEISNYGPKKLVNHLVYIRYWKNENDYMVDRLRVKGRDIINISDVGFFPFLIFVVLLIIFLVWSVWGFYITYIASDEKKMQIIGKK